MRPRVIVSGASCIPDAVRCDIAFDAGAAPAIPVQYAMIHYARWQDGARYPLDIVREGPAMLGSVARRERWIVCARNQQEAHKTVSYHFGHTALWYRLDPPLLSPSDTGPVPENEEQR